jgi:uncharacterized protein YdaU (DUF1376 family)
MSPQADRSPAFQFYPTDWDSDSNVIPMSYEEEGVYFALCRRYWLDGTLPHDLDRLRKLLKGRPSLAKMQRWWDAIAPCFQVDGNSLTHKRLDREREAQAAYREAKARAGSIGGRARSAQAEAKQNEAVLDSASSKIQANASSSSSSSTPSSSPKRESEMPAPVLSIRRGAGPMGSSYLSQSTQAVAALWTHPKGFTMGAGRYYSKLLANFDGNEPELHAWMNRKVDEHISAGGKVGDLFKFFDTALDTEFGAKVTARERAMNAEW